MSRTPFFTSGFTLLEILLVVALGLILASAAYLVNVQSIRAHEFQRAHETLQRELWRARADTIAHTKDSNWGVYVSVHSLTRYRGNTYVSRQTQDDIVRTFPEYVTFPSSEDVTFQRPAGTLVSQKMITVTGQNQSASTTISILGTITTSP